MEKLISRLADDPSVQETISYANTPQYLFRRLRASSAVHALTDIYEGEDLFQLLVSLATQREEEHQKFAEQYLLLAALSVNTIEKLSDRLLSVDLGHLPWANNIRGLIRDGYAPTTNDTIDFPGNAKVTQ